MAVAGAVASTFGIRPLEGAFGVCRTRLPSPGMSVRFRLGAGGSLKSRMSQGGLGAPDQAGIRVLLGARYEPPNEKN